MMKIIKDQYTLIKQSYLKIIMERCKARCMCVVFFDRKH